MLFVLVSSVKIHHDRWRHSHQRQEAKSYPHSCLDSMFERLRQNDCEGNNEDDYDTRYEARG